MKPFTERLPRLMPALRRPRQARRPATIAALLSAALALMWTSADAQLADQMFQFVIDRAGQTCKKIEKTRALGKVSKGDALVAVACAGGGRHVVAIHTDNSLSYMTTCAELQSQTGIDCFDSKH